MATKKTGGSQRAGGQPQPIATGTVGPGKGPPKGPMWDRLTAARTAKQLADLDAEAARNGYAADGQLRRAIAQRRGGT